MQQDWLFLISIILLVLTILPSNYLRLPPQDGEVSGGEACRDLRGLLSMPLLRLPPWLPAGLAEILWLPDSTSASETETRSCGSPILNS